MGFFYKLKKAIIKIKNKLIVAAILLLVIIITGVAPFSVAVRDGISQVNSNELFNWEIFFIELGIGLTKPLEQLTKCFTPNYIGYFLEVTKWFIGFYGLFVVIGIAKAFPKHEYDGIENGSSDWSENGEQYKVLSKNKGIVLAEKNFLPVDKRGNVNVLVVRRFWCR